LRTAQGMMVYDTMVMEKRENHVAIFKLSVGNCHTKENPL